MKPDSKLNVILAGIQEQVQTEIEDIKRETEKELNLLKKEFEKTRNKNITEQKHEFEKEGELKKRKMLTAVRLDKKKAVLKKKQGILNSIFNEAVLHLKKLKKEDYQKFIENLLKEVVVSGNENIHPSQNEKIFSKDYIDKLNNKYRWNLKVKTGTAGMEDGFILKGVEYETVVDWNSIKDFIRQKEEEKVVRELFTEFKHE